MGNAQVRNVELENEITAVLALVPQAIQDATPVLSSAINTNDTDKRNRRILLIASHKEATATAHTMAFTVTESATSGGTYTAATTTGTLTASSADSITRVVSIRRNPAMPYIKVTATGSHADVDVIVSATVLFIGQAI